MSASMQIAVGVLVCEKASKHIYPFLKMPHVHLTTYSVPGRSVDPCREPTRNFPVKERVIS